MTNRRLAVIFGTLVVAAAVALVAGYGMTAAGIAAGAPLALFNYYAMQRAVRKAEQLPIAAGTRRILLVSFGRTLLGMAALLAALPAGVEFLMGVLLALVSESLGYMAGLPGRQSRG